MHVKKRTEILLKPALHYLIVLYFQLTGRRGKRGESGWSVPVTAVHVLCVRVLEVSEVSSNKLGAGRPIILAAVWEILGIVFSL